MAQKKRPGTVTFGHGQPDTVGRYELYVDLDTMLAYGDPGGKPRRVQSDLGDLAGTGFQIETTHGAVETRPEGAAFTTLKGDDVVAVLGETVYVLDEGRVIRYDPVHDDADAAGYVAIGAPLATLAAAGHVQDASGGTVAAEVADVTALADEPGADGAIREVRGVAGGRFVWASAWATVQARYRWAANLTEVQATAAGLIVDANEVDASLWVRRWDGDVMRPEWAAGGVNATGDANRAALAAQVNAANLMGGAEIILSGGTYYVAGDPHIKNDEFTRAQINLTDTTGIKITGQGMDSTVIRLPFSTGSPNGFFSDDEDEAGSYYHDQHALLLHRTTSLRVKDLTIHGSRNDITLQQLREDGELKFKKENGELVLDDNGDPIPVYEELMNAVEVTDSTDCIFERVRFEAWRGDGVRMFKKDGQGEGYTVRDFRFTDCKFYDLYRTGIGFTRGVERVYLTRPVFEQVRWQSISCETAGTFAPRNIHVTDFYIDGGYGSDGFESVIPVAIEGISGADQVQNVFFTNGEITRSVKDESAMEFRWVKNLRLTNVKWSGYAKVFAECKDVVFTDCYGVVEEADGDVGNNKGVIFVIAESNATSRLDMLTVRGGKLEVLHDASCPALRLNDMEGIRLDGVELTGPGVAGAVAVRISQTAGPARLGEDYFVESCIVRAWERGILLSSGSADWQMEGVHVVNNHFHGTAVVPMTRAIDLNDMAWADLTELGGIPTIIGNTATHVTALIAETGDVGYIHVGGNAGSSGAVYEGTGEPDDDTDDRPTLPATRGMMYFRRDGAGDPRRVADGASWIDLSA